MRAAVFKNYPDDYAVVNELHRNEELSVRLAYNSSPETERGTGATSRIGRKMTKSRAGERFLSRQWPGEMLVFSAAVSRTFLSAPDMVSRDGNRAKGCR